MIDDRSGVECPPRAGADRRRPRRRARRGPWVPEAVLAAGAVGFAALNGSWIWTVRRGLPFSIDEAGYLQRAIRDGQHLVHGGAGGLLAAIRTPDIRAPLVQVVASLAYPLGSHRPLGTAGQPPSVLRGDRGRCLCAGSGIAAALVGSADSASGRMHTGGLGPVEKLHVSGDGHGYLRRCGRGPDRSTGRSPTRPSPSGARGIQRVTAATSGSRLGCRTLKTSRPHVELR